VVLGSSVEVAAKKGMRVAKGGLDVSRIGIGRLVKQAVSDISESHRGGNTHLGVCLLFVPLAASAAKAYGETGGISPSVLRGNVKEVMRTTTPQDAVAVYEAITLVSTPHELGRLSGRLAPDLYDKRAAKRILEEGLSLFDIMANASSYDTIARELATGMELSFSLGYEALIETFNRTGDINTATVHTFLRILSEVPDTFIARKVGLKKVNDIDKAVEIGITDTKWISETAEQVLSLGGLTTAKGTSALWGFDRKLQSLGKDYSPGTTADLTAAALMIALLCGLKF
jgi:triphosphoribosyl-dephospho-CoA synthase